MLLSVKNHTFILISFAIMSNCFDFLPDKLFNIQLVDIGYLIFYTSALYTVKPSTLFRNHTEGYVKVLDLFMLLMLVSLFWSLFVFKYPVIESIKASRHMLLGYLLYYIFVQIFEKNGKAFHSILDSLYYITFFLMFVFIAQYHLNIPIFSGYTRVSSEGIRSIPMFIPIILLFLWNNASKILLGVHTRMFDKFYVLLACYSVVLTMTRGIYFAVFLTLSVMVMVLISQNKGNRVRLYFVLTSIMVLIAVLVVSGALGDKLDKFADLAASGVSDIKGDSKGDENTFGFRMLLLAERSELVLSHNPFIGYGFIHEDIAAKQVKYIIGTANDDTGFPSFLTPDIAWANLLVYTGFTGVGVFIVFFVSIAVNFFRNKVASDNEFYLSRLAFFMEIIVLVVLMADSSIFTDKLHIPSLMLASFTYCSRQAKLAS